MQGSLEAPPIVIRAARWKSLLYFLIGAGFLAIAVLMLASEHTLTMRIEALFILFVFGLCVLLFGWQLVRPASLAISPDGILLRQLWRTARWTWREVDNFRVVPLGPSTEQVGFDYTDVFDRQRRAARAQCCGRGRRGVVRRGLGAFPVEPLRAAARRPHEVDRRAAPSDKIVTLAAIACSLAVTEQSPRLKRFARCHLHGRRDDSF